jgi:hypothetical protein
MNAPHYFAPNWRVSIGLTLIALAFFGALTVHDLLRPNKRIYARGLLWIDLGLLSRLIQTLFFWSAHQSQLLVVWHLVNAVLLVWGFVLFLGAWRQERSRKRGVAVDPSRN